jgi:hypothetical protein
MRVIRNLKRNDPPGRFVNKTFGSVVSKCIVYSVVSIVMFPIQAGFGLGLGSS